jgi:hypothetical protein
LIIFNVYLIQMAKLTIELLYTIRFQISLGTVNP